MKIISIDVGIKNIAYCILDIDPVHHDTTIVSWDVISLLGHESKCSQPSCRFNACLENPHNNTYWCKTHAKKNKLLMPPITTKVKDLHKQCLDLHLIAENDTSLKKLELRALLATQCCIPMKKKSSRSLSMIDIGFAIKDILGKRFKEYTFDAAIIEQQMTARMKGIQAMLAQYFIMMDVPIVQFIPAYRKLSRFHPELMVPITKKKKAGYAQRKNAAIQNVKILLRENKGLFSLFQVHKKKDDMADSLLQGLWYASTIDSSCILQIK